MEFLGYWNLQGYEDVPGTLIIDNENISLELMGTLKGELREDFDKFKVNESIIHGFTKCGKEMTLLNCFCTLKSMSFSGIDSEIYSVRCILIGKEYTDSAEIGIKAIQCEMDYLNSWLLKGGFEIVKDIKTNEVVVNSKYHKKIIHSVRDFNIEFYFRRDFKGDYINNYQLKQSAYIKFGYLEEVELYKAIDDIETFSDFLTLCIGKKARYGNLSFIDTNGDEIQVITRKTQIKIKHLKNNDSCIRYREIEHEFETIFTIWQEKNEKLMPMITNLIKAIDDNRVFNVQVDFLSMIMALESFSRRMRNNCKEDEQYHNIRVDSILESVDEEYKEWLESKLNYSNEPTLRTRLKSMIDELSFFIPITGKARKNLVMKAIETRNYYIHYSEDKKDKIMKGNESWAFYMYLKISLRILILMEVGIKSDVVIAALDNKDISYIRTIKRTFGIAK